MMLTLILSEVKVAWRLWIGTFIVLTYSAMLAGAVANELATADALPAESFARNGLANHAGIFAGFNAVALIICLFIIIGLAVSLQKRQHALWQFAGLGPRHLRRVVVGQVTIVAMVAGLVGLLLSLPLTNFFINTVPKLAGAQSSRSEWPNHVPVAWSALNLLVAWLAVVAVAVACSFLAANRAAKTPAITALRSPQEKGQRFGVVRVVLLAAALGWLAYGRYEALAKGEEDKLFYIRLVIVFILVAPLLVPLVMRGWTALVPAGNSSVWFLARSSALYYIERSGATVSLLVVPGLLLVGLMAGWVIGDPCVENDEFNCGSPYANLLPMLLLFGSPIFLICLTAAITIFMATRDRSREYALLSVTGGTPAAIKRAALVECLIYVVTAALVILVGVALYPTFDPYYLPSRLIAVMVLLLLGFALIVGAIYVPARRAFKGSPKEALTAP